MTNRYSLMLMLGLSLITAACTINPSSDGLVREMNFVPKQSAIPASEQHKIGEIARFMADNPSRKVSVDNRQERDPGFPRTESLSDLRQDSIRAALVEAGVSDTRIRTWWHDGTISN